MFKRRVRTAVLVLTQCFAVVVQAQTVTTLTPTPFDASGDLSVAANGDIFAANGGDPNSGQLGGDVLRVSPTGAVSPFVSGLGGAVGNDFDSQGNLFQVNVSPPRIYKITPAGEMSTFADRGRLNQPLGLTLDSRGNVYVGNCLGQNVLKFTPSGEESVFYESEPNSCPLGVATDDQDNLYVSNAHTPFIIKITPAGEVTDFAGTGRWTGRDSLNQHMVYANDRLYLASEGANRVFEVSMEGEVSVLAGTGSEGNDDGLLLEATFTRPRGFGVSPDGGKLYVTSRVPPESSPDSWIPNLIRVIAIPGIEGEGFQINPGLNDTWFNPQTNGQGFLITVFPEIGQMFVAWFTYDTERPPEDVEATLGEPGHRWLTAQGPFDGDTASLTIYVTEGGVFDAAEPPANNDGIGDGTMTIEFADCTEGLVTYEMTSPGVSGKIPIQRIVDDNVALCESLASQ